MEMIILLAVFSAVVFFIIYRDASDKSAYTFLIAARSLSPFRIAASLSSGFRDGAGLAAWVAFGYYFDVGAIWLFVGMVLALACLAVLAPRVRELVEDSEIYSLNQFVGKFIGKNSGYLSVAILATMAILIAGAQLYVSGKVLSIVIGVPMFYGIISISIFVGTYLIIGGYRAVVLTDIFEWSVLFIVFLIPLFVLSDGREIQANWNALVSPGVLLYSLVPLVFLIIATGGDVWQRLFSARDGKAARWGLLLTIPFYFVLSVGVVLLALSIKAALPEAEASSAFFNMFESTIFSGWLVAVLGVFTVAALTSTIDTQTFVFASALSSSIRRRKGNLKTAGDADVSLTRWLIVGFLSVVTLLAYSIGDIVIFLFSSYSISTILLPVLILIVIRGKSIMKTPGLDMSICGVLTISAIIFVIFWYYGYYSNLAFTLVAPVISIVGTILVALILDTRSTRQ